MSTGPHQLLEGGLVQVALECELAKGLPRRLVRLHLDGAALHRILMADGAARHQRRPSQSLEALRGKQTLELVRAMFCTTFKHGAPGSGQRFEDSFGLSALRCTQRIPSPQWRYPRTHKLSTRFTPRHQHHTRKTEPFMPFPSQVCEEKQQKQKLRSSHAKGK